MPTALQRVGNSASTPPLTWGFATIAVPHPKTYQGYEGVVRRHLIPELGRKRLDKPTARDVRLFITRLRESCPCRRNG
ncbi:hypothetical protein AB0L00_09910 [Actinoallomurus sp. NPDC052308]|uniref:hypothetical protein n=1 Tax=Actinoallomurus sp. NPDC052308 TaxID=3155530 RepID=UPI0034379039